MPEPATPSAGPGDSVLPRRRYRLRIVLWVLVVAGLVAAFALLPFPDADQLRDWTDRTGPAALIVFLVTHLVVTVVPFPRVAFTLAAGLLFGSATGVAVAWTGAVSSAALAFFLVRRIGRERVAARLNREALRVVDGRLQHRGWVAVASLRLIAIVPFSLINYGSAVSAISFRHYLFGTMTGILPGTIALVLLGDAVSGDQPPGLLTISAVCAVAGVTGLGWELKPVWRRLRS